MHGAKYNFSLFIHGIGNNLRRLVDFHHAEIRASGNIEQHAFGAFNGNFKKRRVDGELRRFSGAIFAGSNPYAHQSGTGILHNGFNVIEININYAGQSYQIGNPLHCLPQNIVNYFKRLQK